MSHFLLKNAYKYDEPKSTQTPENGIFNEQFGYWNDSETCEVLVVNNGFSHLCTKKEDMETGEDQKGE